MVKALEDWEGKRMMFRMITALSLVPTLALAASNEADSAPPQKTETIGRPHQCGPGFYPKDLRRKRVEGVTTLGFTITADGRVRNIEVVQSSGNRVLDRMAELCARSWHYIPAMKDGKTTEVQWRASVVWRVPPEPPPPTSSEPSPALSNQ
jgi:TonB family protein